MPLIVHFLSRGNTVGGWGAETQGFYATTVVLDANGRGARGGTPREDGAKNGNVETVKHDFSVIESKAGGKVIFVLLFTCSSLEEKMFVWLSKRVLVVCLINDEIS